jgi:asparagine synthase (glutamine-hydrolysing)
MCGIAGAFGTGQDDGRVRQMIDALAHRGPDDQGVWCTDDESVTLGHRRLSIVDLSPSGAQPMSSGSGRYVTAFNGEIYNYKELAAELAATGWRPRGSSDTEIMLAAIDVWGMEQAIAKLNGMFAAAIYDRERARLFLFRDRLGVKPLYYQWRGGRLSFSSEMTRSFTAASDRTIDRTALALYFRYNYIPAPFTIYTDIKKATPGVLYEVTPESARRNEFSRSEPYWSALAVIDANLARPRLSGSLDESVRLVDDALAASVKDRMVADVPVGAFLSGGIDSSLVVAHMQAQSTQRVRTFTIGFDVEKHNEADHARRVAEHLGTDHTEFVVTEQDALDTIPNLPAMYGEPFADSSQIPTYLVSRLTRRSVTVALSGDGGDELFAGYRSYQSLARAQSVFSYVPRGMYVAAARVLRSPRLQQALHARVGEQRYEWVFNALRLFAQSEEGRIPRGVHARYSIPERIVLGISPGDSVLPYRRVAASVAEQMMAHDTCVYLPDDILAKVDRASMAVSLEVRAPFVDDWRLFELAWRIPFEHKISDAGGKIVLKEALARHLPRSLFERPKMGFGIPLSRWLNGPLKPWVEACTDPARIAREGLLDPAVVARIVTCADSTDDWAAYKLWAVCIFQSWLGDVHRV